MSGKYVPPHRRKAAGGGGTSLRDRFEMAKKKSAPPTKFAFFGDSFIRLFGLIENPTLNVKAFKGASAKGLGRDGNENREMIRKFVQDHQSTLDRTVFSFGSVDVHLSYYYKKYVLQEGELNLEEIAVKYVDFVASLPVRDSTVQTIVGVYPSPLDDEVVGSSLVCYGSLTEEQAQQVTESDDALLARRQDRVLQFNAALQARCQETGVQYEDAIEEMMDSDTMKLRKAYLDVSDHNIHIVWETTILLWMDKWPWLKELAPRDLEEKMKKTLKEYLDTKPWAERKHVFQSN